jgi:hypothetical protein
VVYKGHRVLALIFVRLGIRRRGSQPVNIFDVYVTSPITTAIT